MSNIYFEIYNINLIYQQKKISYCILLPFIHIFYSFTHADAVVGSKFAFFGVIISLVKKLLNVHIKFKLPEWEKIHSQEIELVEIAKYILAIFANTRKQEWFFHYYSNKSSLWPICCSSIYNNNSILIVSWGCSINIIIKTQIIIK